MSAPASAGFGDWLLDGGVVDAVLGAYRRRCGTLAPLLADLGLPAGDTGALPALDRARLGGRAIGLLAAQRREEERHPSLRPVDWRVIRYALYGGRTLREAIARCADAFDAIDGRCGRMTSAVAGDRATVCLDAGWHRRDSETCLIDLYGAANIYALLGSLIAQPLPLAGLALDGDRAALAALDLPPPPVPLLTGAGWTGFAFPAAFLDHPVVRTIEEAEERVTLAYLLAPPDGEEAEQLTVRVRRIALRALRDTGHLPPFERVVAATGISAATLRRRLAAAGMSWRAIKDSCRRELALTLLAQPHGSIETLAARLDFCDSDAFRRAFRTWFGMSPSAFRARATGAS